MSKYDNLKNISNNGMTEELSQLAQDDSEIFRVANIESDEQRNLYIYIDNFVDDILEDFGIKKSNRDKIIIDVFNKLKDKENLDLLDFRKAVFECLEGLSSIKTAYPNFINFQKENAKPSYDVDKWVKTLNEIYKEMFNGNTRSVALEKATEGWSPMEKFDFNNWSKFYEGDNHQKYTVKTAAPLDVPQFNNFLPSLAEEGIENNIVEEDLSQINVPKNGPGRPKGSNTPKTPEQQKKSIVDKLIAAQKILQQFANVWPPRIWEALDQALSDLRRQIVLVQVASTKKDCIIKTANIWNRMGFSEGADVLYKIADDVTDDIANAIEGKREKAPEEQPVAEQADMAPPEAPLAAPPEMPPAGAGGDLPPPEMPPLPEEEAPAEVAPEPLKEEVPEPVEDNLKPVEKTEVESENPYIGKTIEDVVATLEPTAQQLSERRVVRELTKADMMLDALNIASHFPELGEAIAKMIESTLYVHTRLEKVISKLKGGLSEGNASNKQEVPVVEMEELTKPSEPAANEKEMFEVSEENEPIK